MRGEGGSGVFVALTQRGLERARTVLSACPGFVIHGLEGRADGADQTFSETTEHLRALFSDGRPIVGVCASGILVRALGPLLVDKRSEPPVVALSEDGRFAVPLLGGHSGANRLAEHLAEAGGGTAAVTTAGDRAFGLALDDPPPGWTLANPESAKGTMAAALAGEGIRLEVEAGEASWITGSDLPLSSHADRVLLVTDRVQSEPPATTVVLHPPVLAMGVGCERGADPKEVIGLTEQTLVDAGLAPQAVACVVSVDVKADERAVHALATHLGVPARFFSPDRLEQETPRLANPSDVVFREVGCHGVAEGAALAAAGAGGELVVEKRKSARATCAIARAVSGIDQRSVGNARGELTVVGIGPGQADWRTPAVTAAIARATDVVGYGLYLDLLGDLIDGKQRHQSDLAQEEARARAALDLAADGRSVVLVSSGDAGIYALATLVFELLDREDRPDWNRLALSVEPGVSAVQAAAARIGAPIGHDFCTISLSDLLTPWEAIETRIEAAAKGDFVIAFYNPVSKRRRKHLATARDILLRERPAGTPVILARNLGRQDECIDVIELGELTPDHADMLTLVLVGSSETRRIERGQNLWAYTPRGYGAKMLSEKEGAA